jgi:hypothetical protein
MERISLTYGTREYIDDRTQVFYAAKSNKLKAIQQCPNVSVVDPPDQAFHLNAEKRS